MLRSIEIICPNMSQMNQIEVSIKRAVQAVQLTTKTKVVFELKKTTNMATASRYSGGSMPPLLIINGALEFSGRVPDVETLKSKILSAIRQG